MQHPRYSASAFTNFAGEPFLFYKIHAMLFVLDEVQLERLSIQRISRVRDGNLFFRLHR
jgi:hypothetical protein